MRPLPLRPDAAPFPALRRRRPSPVGLVAFVVLMMLLVFVASLAACGDAGGDGAVTVQRVDSAGIEIVTGPGEDGVRGARLVEEYRLGGADGGPEGFYRVSGATVGVDGSGRIHVLRPDAGRIERFDATGRHVGSVGQKGEGPGELSSPRSLAVAPDGTAHVYDWGHRGVVRFGPDGAPLPALELPFRYNGMGMRAVEGAVLFEGDGFPEELTRLIRLGSGGDTATLFTYRVPVGERMRMESCGMTIPGLPPVFHPPLRWDARGGRTVAARRAAYDLEVWEGGRPVRRIRRAITPPAATDEAAVASLGDGFRVGIPGGERICDPEEQVELRGVAEQVPLTGALRLAPEGTLWVQRHGATPDDQPPIDLFGADGAYRGSLPSGTPFPIAFLPDGRVLWSETDDVDVQRLVVGRLVESAEEGASP